MPTILVAISTSNISVSLVCMVRRPTDVSNPMDTNATQLERLRVVTERLVRRLRRAAAATSASNLTKSPTIDALDEASGDSEDALRAALFDDVERPRTGDTHHQELNETAATEAGKNAHRSRCALARFRKRAVELSRRFGEASVSDDEAELERLSSVTSERCFAEQKFDWTSTQTGEATTIASVARNCPLACLQASSSPRKTPARYSCWSPAPKPTASTPNGRK